VNKKNWQTYLAPVSVLIIVLAIWLNNEADGDRATLSPAPQAAQQQRTSGDPSLDNAEALLAEFKCDRPASVEDQRLMAEDKRRAAQFIQKYKEGAHGFNISIEEVVHNHLQMFKASCSGTGF
jgi:hypothetical protein